MPLTLSKFTLQHSTSFHIDSNFSAKKVLADI